jgi:hypothetical protein
MTVRLAFAVMVCAALWSPPVRAAETTPVNPLAAVPLDQLSETTERPLFTPSRHKPPPEVAAAPVEAPPPPPPAAPKLALFGIIQDEHGPRAIVKPGAGADDKTLGLRIGDKVESWSVTAINRTQLTLSLKERSVVFSMFDENGTNGEPRIVRHHPARVIELNAAGVLTARSVGGPQP